MRKASGYDESSSFIEPSYLKLFDHGFLLKIWQQAFKAIQDSEKLFIVGYSLPEPDSAIKLFLSTVVRNSKITSISVINPNPVNKINIKKYHPREFADTASQQSVFEKFIRAPKYQR